MSAGFSLPGKPRGEQRGERIPGKIPTAKSFFPKLDFFRDIPKDKSLKSFKHLDFPPFFLSPFPGWGWEAEANANHRDKTSGNLRERDTSIPPRRLRHGPKTTPEEPFMGPYFRRGAKEPALIPESMDLGKRGAFPASFPGAPAPFPWSSRCLLRVASFFPPDGSLTHLAPAPAAFFLFFFFWTKGEVEPRTKEKKKAGIRGVMLPEGWETPRE